MESCLFPNYASKEDIEHHI